MRQYETEFAEFYLASHARCFRAVAVGVGSADLVEDLVAEAYSRALLSWRTVRTHPAPEAWVVRTALNTRVSWWRRRHREVPLDTAEPEDVTRASAQEPGWGADTAPDPALLAALQRLPRRQREVIALRVFLDLDIATTARILGIAPGTVGAHQSRAVATLRSLVIPNADQPRTGFAIDEEISR